MVDDEWQVLQLIARFANSFDLKAWDALRDCLAESLRTDYSDLRGSQPEIVSRDRFVELRRRALDRLTMHHLAGLPEVTMEDTRGRCRASMVTWRRDERGGAFDTHCRYLLEVTRAPDGWRISSIAQKVLWNAGDPTLHAGAGKA